ncbi:hypothetical protein JOD43_002982 [Pullulanibacillus pueri]|uniref:Uncharacterized protein n=1 Tax=Pullulanibacillus pueri TaxID=1437324 RepID=A0A8J2ZWA4_9BACL|nr:hypothetical protein [Pullulanibacillus pueri]MBM7682803.1 hypothetical protein [Pullulanibacillus pueri]GGH83246.1 hypothetical protein GCM10007096_23830 [Pullulanibacillus pueri]
MKDTMLSLQVECTYFFEENPYAMETVQSLANRLGRAIETLEPIVNQLVSLSILSKMGSGDETIYRYNQPTMMNEKLDAPWENL